jgi:hypothetical protein
MMDRTTSPSSRGRSPSGLMAMAARRTTRRLRRGTTSSLRCRPGRVARQDRAPRERYEACSGVIFGDDGGVCYADERVTYADCEEVTEPGEGSLTPTARTKRRSTCSSMSTVPPPAPETNAVARRTSRGRTRRRSPPQMQSGTTYSDTAGWLRLWLRRCCGRCESRRLPSSATRWRTHVQCLDASLPDSSLAWCARNGPPTSRRVAARARTGHSVSSSCDGCLRQRGRT